MADFQRTALSKKTQKASFLFAVLSCILHCSLIGGLGVVAFHPEPIKALLTEKKRERTISVEKVEVLAEHIRNANMEDLRATANNLLLIKHEMDSIADERNKTLMRFSREQIQKAPTETVTFIEEALGTMETASNALHAIQSFELKTLSAQQKENSKEAQDAVKVKKKEYRTKVEKSQRSAENAMEAALTIIAWLGDESLVEMQTNALSMQSKAKGSNEKARAAFDRVYYEAGKILSYQGTMRKYSAELEKRTNDAEALKKKLPANKGKINAAQRKVQESRKRLKQTQQRIDDLAKRLPESKRKWKESRDAAIAEQQQATAAQKTLSDTLAKVTGEKTRTIPEPILVGKPRDPEADFLTMNMAELYHTCDTLEATVVGEYRDLRAVELAMLRGMTLPTAVHNIDAPKPERAVIPEQQLIGTPRTVSGLDRQKESIKTALLEADKMERYCAALLEALRFEEEAVELAMTETEEPQPSDSAGGAVIDTEELQQALQEAIQKVAETAEAAKQNVKEMAEATQEDDKKDEAVTPEIRNALQETKATSTKATDLEKKFEDLSPEVNKLEEIVTKAEEATKELTAISETATAEVITVKRVESKTKDVVAKKETQEAVQATEHLAAIAKVAATEMAEAAEKAVELVAQIKESAGNRKADKLEAMLAKAKAMEGAAAETSAKAADISKLMKTDPEMLKNIGTDAKSVKALMALVNTKTPHPVITKKTKGMVWGRKIASTDGVAAQWLMVDSWYVVGPWPNPNRANRDRKFPPENKVDLDAQYIGKGGRALKWDFIQATEDVHPSMLSPNIFSQYAIYYFYTEVHSDEERDIWFSTGSDDKSKIWINDMLVWESAPQHKGWRIDEGYRKVHLRKGVNKVLYRLENGWHGMGMSFIFHTAPEKQDARPE